MTAEIYKILLKALEDLCLYRRSIKNFYLFAYNHWNQNQRIAAFENTSTSNLNLRKLGRY